MNNSCTHTTTKWVNYPYENWITGEMIDDPRPVDILLPGTKLDESFHQTILNQLDNIRKANEAIDLQVANYYRDK